MTITTFQVYNLNTGAVAFEAATFKAALSFLDQASGRLALRKIDRVVA